MNDVKTVEQLRQELAYYQRILEQSTSRDRIRRAKIAIRIRERQLEESVGRDE